jgi:hypothetical protein
MTLVRWWLHMGFHRLAGGGPKSDAAVPPAIHMAASLRLPTGAIRAKRSTDRAREGAEVTTSQAERPFRRVLQTRPVGLGRATHVFVYQGKVVDDRANLPRVPRDESLPRVLDRPRAWLGRPVMTPGGNSFNWRARPGQPALAALGTRPSRARLIAQGHCLLRWPLA